MSLSQGIGSPREFDDGLTSVQQANQFVNIRIGQDVRDLVKRLEQLASVASRPEVLRRCVRKASKPIMDGYSSRAKMHEATGNLAASVTRKYVDYASAAVAVVGPRQTGPVGSTSSRRSGNHAWLVEFGTSARKPGTKGRRTYINVHQAINFRMRRAGSFNNDQFARMGSGYYFLMGSINEPSRQGGGKPGYSRDFAGPGPGGDGRQQHPITLRPGETIAAMPALRLMEETIASTASQSLAMLRGALEAEINARGG
jgi:hypothetical protein